jgi:hypothetical protein
LGCNIHDKEVQYGIADNSTLSRTQIPQNPFTNLDNTHNEEVRLFSMKKLAEGVMRKKKFMKTPRKPVGPKLGCTIHDKEAQYGIVDNSTLSRTQIPRNPFTNLDNTHNEEVRFLSMKKLAEGVMRKKKLMKTPRKPVGPKLGCTIHDKEVQYGIVDNSTLSRTQIPRNPFTNLDKNTHNEEA